MRKFILILFIATSFTFIRCGSNENAVFQEDDILTETSWLRKDMDAEIIYGGGDNYLRINFKKSNNYEIVQLKGERITGLKEEGAYALTDNKDLVITTTKNQQKLSLRYVLVNDRTLNRVNEKGEVLSNAYEAYIKQ
ncbi:MAG TPA: hypothetical protein DCW66_13390 [Sphingobacterium sp.]|uniref:hypothetical protein n=1 Tax=Sphingobacterium multivorum TaxID=28454 RepID=UPI000E829019|nr:hypothetical protein [Sphingobacterium multivorum]HAU54160.1 hypothetical protein [Sphingobacterium sp.]